MNSLGIYNLYCEMCVDLYCGLYTFKTHTHTVRIHKQTFDLDLLFRETQHRGEKKLLLGI